MIEAMRAYARGCADGGTTAERIARAEAAMVEVGRIADTADPVGEGRNPGLQRVALHAQDGAGARHSVKVTSHWELLAQQAMASITELYSQQKLNEYIDELGLEEIAPGIKAADAKKSYRELLPAAEQQREGPEREG